MGVGPIYGNAICSGGRELPRPTLVEVNPLGVKQEECDGRGVAG